MPGLVPVMVHFVPPLHGLKNLRVSLHHFVNVIAGFCIGRHAAIFLHGLGPCIVGRQGQCGALKGCHLLQQVPRATVQVLLRICGVNAQVPGGSWHKLRQTHGPNRGAGIWIVIAFDLNHGLEECRPLAGRHLEIAQGRIVLVLGRHGSDERQ